MGNNISNNTVFTKLTKTNCGKNEVRPLIQGAIEAVITKRIPRNTRLRTSALPSDEYFLLVEAGKYQIY
jgi:hypothetical protein